MVKFEFYLDSVDFDRMTVAKRKLGKDDLTFEQFAKWIVVKELHKLQPSVPTDEELDV